MAQRNPLNERYQGDGPGGQTRKSAARAKPVTQAAASVHVKKKPQTDAEKRAARKAREKEEERKAAERARRRAERAKAEADAADEPDAATLVKSARGSKSMVKTGEKAEAKAEAKVEPRAAEQPKGFLGKLLAPAPNMPSTEEYRKWRKRYWMLIAIGLFFLVSSLAIQTLQLTDSPALMISIGCAYAAILAAFFVDFRKVKPLVKEHQKHGLGNKSPKQLKHEQEAKERAEALEAARKMEREAKKGRRRKKPRDAIVPGDEQ
jgi:hypothetical protein